MPVTQQNGKIATSQFFWNWGCNAQYALKKWNTQKNLQTLTVCQSTHITRTHTRTHTLRWGLHAVTFKQGAERMRMTNERA